MSFFCLVLSIGNRINQVIIDEYLFYIVEVYIKNYHQEINFSNSLDFKLFFLISLYHKFRTKTFRNLKFDFFL